MLRQFVFGVEESVARQTNVGPVFLVDAAHVFLQMGQLQEGRGAQLTLERLLARMQPDVKFQRRRVRKGLFANLTLVRTFSLIISIDFVNVHFCRNRNATDGLPCESSCGL